MDDGKIIGVSRDESDIATGLRGNERCKNSAILIAIFRF
jgi:hypothetical protein